MAGNPIGNGLMSCGCLIFLIPIMGLLLLVIFSTIAAIFGG